MRDPARPPSGNHDLLESLIDDDDAVRLLQAVAPSAYAAVSRYWATPFNTMTLTPRMTELVLLAMHGATSSLNADAVVRHVHRALAVGATPGDVIDVMVTIMGQANHSLYMSIPMLEEELTASGRNLEFAESADDEAVARARETFVVARGFWNPSREVLARLIPDYFVALTGISTDSWINGSLADKERLLILIGINSTITHTYEPGLRSHIRLALQGGATQAEILDVFQLAGLMGLEGFVLAARALVEDPG
jgi:alkylhydroperoxidase/carboxymuconolactone decarboxylase family protein YurZ